MTDALSLLEAKNKKLAKQIDQLRAKLDAAESEYTDNQTAIKVLSRLGVATPVESVDETKTSSQDQVLNVLPTDAAKAMTPRDVNQALEAQGISIKADNVRTILLRLKKTEAVSVTDTGKYWRETREADANGFDEFSADDFDDLDDLPGTTVTGPPSRPQPQAFDDDLDSDVPF